MIKCNKNRIDKIHKMERFDSLPTVRQNSFIDIIDVKKKFPLKHNQENSVKEYPKFRMGTFYSSKNNHFDSFYKTQTFEKKTWQNSKLEQSFMKFSEKENTLTKIENQQRKQKKNFKAEALGREEEEMFKMYNTISNKRAREEMIEERNSIEYPLINLKSSCYDSPFVFKREGSCLTMLNNRLYLFGGAIRKQISVVTEKEIGMNSEVQFHSYNENGKWTKEYIDGDIPLYRKNFICHTTVGVNSKFIVVVGGLVGDSKQTLNTFNRSILAYNTEKKTMTEFQWNIGLRSHSCTSYEQLVLIHGGINEERMIKNELYVITVTGNQSANVKVNTIETNESLVYHKIVTTLGEDKNFKMSLRENNGIFLFGGEGVNGIMSNEMKIFKFYSSAEFERKGIKNFETLQTFGERPSGRKNHSMNLISKKSFIVIMGGEDFKSTILSDSWTLNLQTLNWTRIETDPNIDFFLGGITRHATVSNSESIFIMGGYHPKDVGSSNLWRFDLAINEKKPMKSRRASDASKMSSMWSFKFGGIDFGNF